MLVGGGGVQDALEGLGAHPEDWLYRQALIVKTAELDQKRRRAEIEAMGKTIGAEVAKTVVKAFGG